MWYDLSKISFALLLRLGYVSYRFLQVHIIKLVRFFLPAVFMKWVDQTKSEKRPPPKYLGTQLQKSKYKMGNIHCQPGMQLQLAKQPGFNRLFQKTSKQGGLRTYVLVEKNPWNFNKFVTLPLEIPEKTKPHPWKFDKIALQKRVTPLKFQDQKAKPLFYTNFS